MSRNGDCWDHAVMESFFSSLKTERTSRKNYQTRDEARADVFDYIVWSLAGRGSGAIWKEQPRTWVSQKGCRPYARPSLMLLSSEIPARDLPACGRFHTASGRGCVKTPIQDRCGTTIAARRSPDQL